MISTVVKKAPLISSIEEGLVSLGVAEDLADVITLVFAIAILVVSIMAVDWLLAKILKLFADRVIRRTKTRWDDFLLDRKFFNHTSRFILWVVVVQVIDKLFVGFNSDVITILIKISKITAIFYANMVLYSLLDVLHDLYHTTPISKQKSVKGYIQTTKILVAITMVVSAFLVLFNINITIFLTSIAASAAVISFIFKDTILGFVSSVQLSSLDLIRLGDWVTIPSKEVDGEVIDLSLTTVKVQNWNLSVVAIPIYMLSADSFVNWRYMRDGMGGRRFKRQLFIDLFSITSLSQNKLASLAENPITAQWAKEALLDVNMAECTNLSLFRSYFCHFLQGLEALKQSDNPNLYFGEIEDKGLPIVLYGFTKDKSWKGHEDQVADIIQHAIIVLSIFELRLYQRAASTPPAKADYSN